MNKEEPIEKRFSKRSELQFSEATVEAFAFLEDMGFCKFKASPTSVEYKRAEVVVTIYHGRQSFEVGFEVVCEGVTYALSELMRVEDPNAAMNYRNPVARTSHSVRAALNQLKNLVQKYALRAFQKDPAFLLILGRNRKEWAEALGLETRVSLLKPKAEEAFRLKEYAKAYELYEQIREGLTPAEAKKADLARARALKMKLDAQKGTAT